MHIKENIQCQRAISLSPKTKMSGAVAIAQAQSVNFPPSPKAIGFDKPIFGSPLRVNALPIRKRKITTTGVTRRSGICPYYLKNASADLRKEPSTPSKTAAQAAPTPTTTAGKAQSTSCPTATPQAATPIVRSKSYPRSQAARNALAKSQASGLTPAAARPRSLSSSITTRRGPTPAAPRTPLRRAPAAAEPNTPQPPRPKRTPAAPSASFITQVRPPLSLVADETPDWGVDLDRDLDLNGSEDDDSTEMQLDGCYLLPEEVAQCATIVCSSLHLMANPLIFLKTLPPLPDTYKPSPVIPPMLLSSPKKTLVLDLDETLVHCTLEHIEAADFTFDVEFEGKRTSIFGRKRPYLDAFLEQVHRDFEVVVFTASQDIYADKVLDFLDQDRRLIHHRLFRNSCVMANGQFLKELTCLGRDLRDVIIVDNSITSFGYQVDNGIPIESWFEDPRDRSLLALLPILREIRGEQDVRPYLRDKFQLRRLVESVDLQ
mmetsp:Transcript_29146/g.73273  ORF Transcript_29146/g.73273 Transcript_29146/m.73273 type:complete len:489 (+) Transcript_29146:246-1712(+)